MATRPKNPLLYTSFYNSWSGMRNRVNNPNTPNYKNYGGRGIKHSKEWAEFSNFTKDMYAKYQKHVKKHGTHDTTIDRINNDGNYCKENCRWTTRRIQNNNTRSIRTYKINGKWFRWCLPCKTVKPINEFAIAKTQSHGRHGWCKKCYCAYNLKNYYRLKALLKDKGDR